MLLFNTLTRKQEKFVPRRAGKVGIYVCGPTVYDFDHLGHARTFLFFDTLRRFFQFKGFKVTFIQNITDVGHLVGDGDEGEDKIGRRARQEHKTPRQIADFYTRAHFADIQRLGILLPTKAPRASEHIPEIIDLIKKLVAKGVAYERNGEVYFDVSKFKDYGKLSHRSSRTDFVLWRKAAGREIDTWQSPWGRGFPGWHIECSAMAHKYLGRQFDIHGSAVEHIFPHHENEIAQSQAGYGVLPARFWVHTGLLTIQGRKMSKSFGNQLTIRQALKTYPAGALRLALLSTHYRKPLNFTPELVVQYKKVYQRIASSFQQARRVRRAVSNSTFQLIIQALEDDMNLSRALSLFDQGRDEFSYQEFQQLNQIFGLTFQDKKTILNADQKALIQKREVFRRAGKFVQADKIRLQLARRGIRLIDTKTGVKVEQLK